MGTFNTTVDAREVAGMVDAAVRDALRRGPADAAVAGYDVVPGARVITWPQWWPDPSGMEASSPLTTIGYTQAVAVWFGDGHPAHLYQNGAYVHSIGAGEAAAIFGDLRMPSVIPTVEAPVCPVCHGTGRRVSACELCGGTPDRLGDPACMQCSGHGFEVPCTACLDVGAPAAVAPVR